MAEPPNDPHPEPPRDREAYASIRQRLGEEARAAGEMGREALLGPDGVVDTLREFLFRWFRKIWKLRGGGLYAVGFALSFLYLEVTELLLDDIPGFFNLDSYDAGAIIGFVKAMRWLPQHVS